MTRNLTHEMAKRDVACSPEFESSRDMAASSSAGPAVMTRVDAPHEPANVARDSTADEPAAAQLVPDESLSEQISLQAAQLAAHLRGRQQDLDHREAELNARMAMLESDARAARLWIEQHEADLACRSAALAGPQQDLVERCAAVAKSEEVLARRSQELSERDNRLSSQEREVERRLARLAAVEAAQQRGASAPDAAQTEELQTHRQQLAEAERRLTASQAQAQKLCEQLTADRADFAAQSTMLREQVAAERSQALADVAEKRKSLQRRAEQVDQRWAALGQLRAELGRIHRETLEIRLATEELWAQLSGAAPPATLTQSLGRIRAKLAEQYAQANSKAVEQRKATEAIRSQLLIEHEKLVEQKRQFERWAAACREDCQQQATRLVAREQQLHDEKIELRQQWQRWQAERLRYQIELRRLQPQAGAGDTSPAMAE